MVPTFNIVVKGYLTRALKALLPRTRILALDADKAQTIGAQRWERQLPLPTTTTKEENISITHKTIHITPKKLFEIVDEWRMMMPHQRKMDEKKSRFFLLVCTLAVLSPLILYEHLVSRGRVTKCGNLRLPWLLGAVII